MVDKRLITNSTNFQAKIKDQQNFKDTINILSEKNSKDISKLKSGFTRAQIPKYFREFYEGLNLNQIYKIAYYAAHTKSSDKSILAFIDSIKINSIKNADAFIRSGGVSLLQFLGGDADTIYGQTYGKQKQLVDDICQSKHDNLQKQEGYTGSWLKSKKAVILSKQNLDQLLAGEELSPLTVSCIPNDIQTALAGTDPLGKL